MEHSVAESKEGLYDIYYAEDGTRLVVLEGLDPEQQVEVYPMQEFMIRHLETFIVFYWLLVLCVSVYLVSTYIVMPLTRRSRT